MKNKILSVLGLTLFAVACGGYVPEVIDPSGGTDVTDVTAADDVGEVIDEMEDVDDLIIGQSSQAIYVPFAYGIEGDGSSPCAGDWSKDQCTAPDFRVISVNLRLSTCGDLLFQQEMANAGTRFKSFMVGVGWNVKLGQDTYPNLPGDKTFLEVKCTGGSGGGNLGLTEVRDPLTWDYHDAAEGDFIQYQVGRSNIYPTPIKAFTNFATASDTRKRNFVRNIFLHEMFHHAGIGHNSGNPGSSLMVTGPSTNVTTNYWNINLTLNSDERLGIACYNPSSGTSPADHESCPL